MTVPRRKSLWRLLWGLLLLIHAPATVKVFSIAFDGETGWSSVFLITATNLFFILEIIFASLLHVLSSRRNVIAFLLVVVLLHVGAIERGFPDLALLDELDLGLLLSAGLAALWRQLIAPVLCLCRFVGKAADHRRFFAYLLYCFHSDFIAVLRQPDCGWRSSPLRAPPILS
ncbi:MAG: hypothetical protein MI923_08920 [Phycisphaerales bacterium]|nr:hypothetical protein [Phycisphaerales bacterium]